MTTVVEIVDTAVKVGLGALISGIATYMVTSKNHSHEAKKNVAADKKEILLDLVHKLDTAFSIRNSAVQSIWRKYEREDDDLESDYAALTDAVNNLKLAVSYAFLIGRKDMPVLLGKIFSSLEEERKSLESEERNLDVLNEGSDKRILLLNEVREMLPQALESIHA